MHNFSVDIPSISDAYTLTIKGLHTDNKTVVQTNKSDIEASYKDFIDKSKPCVLEKVSPLWMIDASDIDDEKRRKEDTSEIMRSLYVSKRTFRKAHWEAIQKKNGGTQLMCPLCGLNRCHVMDHYAPKEYFAEFSVFTPNLIPLCDDCNERKGNQWLNPNNGRRLFFNAFFDTLPSYELFDCDLTILKGYPALTIQISAQLKSDTSDVDSIVSTIEKLDLVNRLQECAEDVLRKEITRLIESGRSSLYKSFEKFWADRCRCYKEFYADKKTWNMLERIIFRSIISSEVFKSWLKQELSQ